jgi:hypothetical protein
MTAVTVECDEKSVADKAATGRTLSCRAKRGRTMSAVPQAPLRLSLRAGFLEKREKGRTPSYWSNVKKTNPRCTYRIKCPTRPSQLGMTKKGGAPEVRLRKETGQTLP